MPMLSGYHYVTRLTNEYFLIHRSAILSTSAINYESWRLSMKSITKVFFTGLATVLPILATFYLLYWMTTTIETVLGGVLKVFLPEGYYTPGLGIGLGIVLIFAVGLLMRSWFAQILFTMWEGFLLRLPVIKSIYSILQDFFKYFVHGDENRPQQVVSVKLKGSNFRLIGFVTRRDLSKLPAGLGSRDEIAVYLPMSYQIGGYTVLIPRSDVEPIDISMEDAMRFAVTAGVSAGSSKAVVEED